MHRKLSPCSVLRKLLLRCFFFATKSLCDVRAVIIWWMHSERFSCAQAASSSKPQRAGRVSENTEQKDTSAGELWTSSGLSASSRVQLSLQMAVSHCVWTETASIKLSAEHQESVCLLVFYLLQLSGWTSNLVDIIMGHHFSTVRTAGTAGSFCMTLSCG